MFAHQTNKNLIRKNIVCFLVFIRVEETCPVFFLLQSIGGSWWRTLKAIHHNQGVDTINGSIICSQLGAIQCKFNQKGAGTQKGTRTTRDFNLLLTPHSPALSIFGCQKLHYDNEVGSKSALLWMKEKKTEPERGVNARETIILCMCVSLISLLKLQLPATRLVCFAQFNLLSSSNKPCLLLAICTPLRTSVERAKWALK